MHHQGKLGWSPKRFKVGINPVSRSGLVSQCPKIKVLHFWNGIPRAYHHYNWHEATATQIALQKQVKDLHRFLGMVQWAWSSTIEISPHKVGECDNTKVVKAMKPKCDCVIGMRYIEQHLTRWRLITQDVVLTYPDHSKEFDDAYLNQLCSVITQGNRPLAFFRENFL